MRRPRLGFLGVWVFITLSPASSIAPIAAEVGAERRMYLPLMGVMAILVLGIFAFRVPRSAFLVPFSFGRRNNERNNERNGERNEERGTRNAERFLASVVLASTLALATTTFVRNRDYASPLTLARTTLAAWPTANAHQLVGQELATLGQHDEAIQHLREAVSGYPPARYSLGAELFATGQLNEAINELQQFVRDEPDLPPARSARMLIARAHGLLADTLAAERAFAGAIPHYRAFLTADPGNATAWTGLGVALVATGDAPGSADAFRHAVAAAPGDTHMRQNLARALLDRGDAAGALAEAQQAVTLGANDPAAHEILGRVLAAQGRTNDAVRELQRALQIDPSYVPALEALRLIKR
jgi:tetratricopeptide (TPR) repeat protein